MIPRTGNHCQPGRKHHPRIATATPLANAPPAFNMPARAHIYRPCIREPFGDSIGPLPSKRTGRSKGGQVRKK